MTGNIITTTTPTDLLHNVFNFIPTMLDTATDMLTNPIMLVVIGIGLIVGFLINISK